MRIVFALVILVTLYGEAKTQKKQPSVSQILKSPEKVDLSLIDLLKDTSIFKIVSSPDDNTTICG